VAGWLVIAALLVSIYRLTPARALPLRDVLLDSTAALAAQILIFLLLKPARTSATRDTSL